MKDIPPKVLKTFERMKKNESSHIELKTIKNHYYVYRATSEWDKERKKVRKITDYAGSIDHDGVFKKKRARTQIQESRREVFEFGNCMLAHYLIKDIEDLLAERTPYCKELIAAAIIKAIDSKPLRLFSSQWEKFYISKKIDVSLSPKHLSAVLCNIGGNIHMWYELFSKLAIDDDLLLYDLTSVFTYSKNIKLAEKGYNPDHEYIDQIGVIMAFSSITKLPVGIDVFCGSIRDITTIRDFIERFPKKDFGFVFDRGFSSYELLDDLKKLDIHYVVPLKKNSKLIDLRWIRWSKPFLYRGRPIRWGTKKTDYGTLYVFEDPLLRGEEETSLLKRVESDKLSIDEFEQKRKLAGIFCLVSDMKRDEIEMYGLYKSREDVEMAFDAMKNELDSDKTYLRSDEAVRGYFIVTLLAMRIYFKILKRLREKDLTKKISVEEVLFELSKVTKIVEVNGNEYFAKTPKRARQMCSLFPEALPMG